MRKILNICFVAISSRRSITSIIVTFCFAFLHCRRFFFADFLRFILSCACHRISVSKRFSLISLLYFVWQLNASDIDEGENARLRYELVAEADGDDDETDDDDDIIKSSLFAVDEDTGVVTAVASLDRETKSQHRFQVTPIFTLPRASLCHQTALMLSPRNGLEAKNYGLSLGLGLVASGLSLNLVDVWPRPRAVWPRGLLMLRF